MIKKLFFLLLLALTSLMSHATFDPRQGTVRVVIPYAAGGGPDHIYHILERYAARQGIQMVPDYRPGADGQIGAAHAATTKPDGRNLMVTVISDLSTGTQSKNFYPVSAIGQTVMYIVTSSDSKIKNLTQLFSQMQQNPSKLSWANSSQSIDRDIDWIARRHNSSLDQLVFTRFNRGGPTAVAGGHVDIGIWPAVLVEPLVSANKLQVLGTYQNLDPRADGVQSVEQILGKMDRLNGIGVFLPAGTSTQVQQYWSSFVEQFKSDPEVQTMLRNKFFTTFPPGGQVLVDIIEFNRSIEK